MSKKKYPRGTVPPCPGRAEDYSLADRGGYYYWRRKRGTVKPATLNAAMQKRNDAMRALGPVIKQLKMALVPLMQPLPAGTLQNDLFKWLQQYWVDTGLLSFENLQHRDLHRKYRLQKIFHAAYNHAASNEHLQLMLPQCSYAVTPQNKLVTDFVVEAVLLWETSQGFETSTQTSSLYAINKGMHTGCDFSWPLPEQGNWLLLLKLICFEGDEFASHPMHYGIKVIATGDGTQVHPNKPLLY